MGCFADVPEDSRGIFNQILQSKLLTMIILKVPHAFQQHLSHEKTPTLCNAIPAFEAMTTVWEQHQHDHPETAHIVQKGLDKLEEYRDRTDLVPAYVLAMGESLASVYLLLESESLEGLLNIFSH